MKLHTLFFLIICFCIAQVTYAQESTGTVRGSVIDNANGEPLIGVNVLVKGTTRGASTDVEGDFDIVLSPGTYDIRLSYVSYQTKIIKDVKVQGGEIIVLNNIKLKPATEKMGEVVVTAEAVNISEAALLTRKQKSANLLDGISAERMEEAGVSNAADALKKVTGVSIQGGKYVYVRGLGNRYTNTMLNSVEIPSLDPTRNSLQVDIFPAGLIENMVISKTAVAELPADFAGGIVNIETVDFPSKPIFDISASATYNPLMHFNSNYLSYEGSSTDFLGFDGGTRELPQGAQDTDIPTPISSGTSDEQVYNFVNSFNPTLGPTTETNLMDYSLALSLGNQYDVGDGNTIGYIFSGTYKNSSKYYDDFSYGEYQLSPDPETYSLVRSTTRNGRVAEDDVLLGGLAGIAYKTQKSKYKLTAMHLQNGQSKATTFHIDNSASAPGQSGYIGRSYNLGYSERRITNVLLNGVHYFDKAKWKIDWRISPTLSAMTDPDIRNTTYTLRNQGTNTRYLFNAGAGGFPNRIWRFMDEINLVGRAKISRDYKLFGESAKLKFGGSYVYKQRDYEILSYDMAFFGEQPKWTGNPSEILEDENIYGNGTEGVIYYQSGNMIPNPNAYSSNVKKTSLFVSNEFNLGSSLKAILGVRAEQYVQRHTGRSVRFAQGDSTAQNLDNEKVLDALDFFPSVNLTYSLSENMNLRASYSRTIARPSFRELSFAQILDPISDRRFNGGLFAVGCDQNGENCNWDGNLGETRIHNFDLRWEHFYERNQLLSAGVFYKSFDEPIELVRIRTSPTSNEYQPRNVGQGQVYGAEFEVRKSLDFLSPALTNFGINGNLTVVKSTIEMTQSEFQARQDYAKQGQEIDDQRQMAGQAPYIVNAGLTYDNPDLGFDTGLYYNVKGETLVLVGGGIFPDVYSEPFHSLNFSLNKSFGANEKYSLSLNVNNILGDSRQEYYESYQSAQQIYRGFNPHRSVSVGFKYSFR